MRFAVIQAYQRVTTFTRRAFSDRLLFLTNIGISIGLSAVGDVIEQKLELMSGDIEHYEHKRTVHMSVSGMTVGIICHHWYRYLDKLMPGRTMAIVMKKVLIDQIIGSPVCISSFFITLGILENLSYDSMMEEIKSKAWKLYAAEWVVWPVAQIINFSILPTRYRVLYDNTISLGYDIYTSRIKYHSDNKKLPPGLGK